MNKAVGQPLDRVDGRLKVTGGARYAAEYRPPQVAHAVIVSCTIARGRLESIDTAAALHAGGVITILTSENIPPIHLPPTGDPNAVATEHLLPLWGGPIQFAGQIIAVVVAETLDQARHAASRLQAHYQEEKPVLTIAAAEPDGYFPQKSHGEAVQYHRGDVSGALAAPGGVKIEQAYTMPVETHNPMEPAATVAEWQGDRLTVHDSTRYIMGTRAVLAQVFALPKEQVRVVCPFVGGAFGSKNFRWSHTILAALAARAIGRPVKLALSRAQMFIAEGHRPATIQRLALAAGRDGRLAAIRHETVQTTSFTSEFIVTSGIVSKMLYACPNVATPHKLARVNMATPTYMRAPAENPGTFALESALDELAYAVDLDPLELRRRNYADKDPVTGKPWSSKYLQECYTRGAEKFGWQHRNPAPRSMQDGSLLVGWGMATALYPAHRQPASARVLLKADGTALVQAATHDIGNGAYTVFTQVSADALGLPAAQVTFELGDSDFPMAPGAGGSVTTASVSEAIIQAVAALQTKLAALATADPRSPLAGLGPEALAGADGRLFARDNPARGAAFVEILGSAGRPELEATASVTPEDAARSPVVTQSFGVQFCEVKIDPGLPRVQVTRFVSVFDCGRILNPKTSRSQALGGVIMGIGMALMEHTAYDPRSGRPVNDNFADYAVPVNADVGTLDVEFIEHPDLRLDSLGCRGVGEIPITGVAAAIANAVYHATGSRVRDLPITPDKLL